MGYTSCVAIKTTKTAYKEFKKITDKFKMCPDIFRDKQENEYVFTWHWEKWYEEFEDIAAVTSLMDDIDSGKYSDEYKYMFLRYGENFEDIEQRGSLDLYLGVIQEFDLGINEDDIEEI